MWLTIESILGLLAALSLMGWLGLNLYASRSEDENLASKLEDIALKLMFLGWGFVGLAVILGFLGSIFRQINSTLL